MPRVRHSTQRTGGGGQMKRFLVAAVIAGLVSVPGVAQASSTGSSPAGGCAVTIVDEFTAQSCSFVTTTGTINYRIAAATSGGWHVDYLVSAYAPDGQLDISASGELVGSIFSPIGTATGMLTGTPG